MTVLSNILLGALQANTQVVELPIQEMQVVSNPILLIISDEGQPTRTYHFEVQRVGQQVFAINPIMAERRARTRLLWAIAGLEGAARPTNGGRWKMLGRTYRTRKLARRAAREHMRIPHDIDVDVELMRLNSGHPPASHELARATSSLILPGSVPNE